MTVDPEHIYYMMPNDGNILHMVYDVNDDPLQTVDEVHVWCLLDYGVVTCNNKRKDCDQDVSFGVVLFQIAERSLTPDLSSSTQR